MSYLKYLFFGCLAATILCGASDDKKNATSVVTDDGRYIFAPSTTTMQQAITLYQMGEDGLFQKDSLISVNDSIVLKPEEIISFNQKKSEVIYSTERGVFSVIVDNDFKKKLKSDKKVNKLKDKDLKKRIQEETDQLDARIDELNAKRLTAVEHQNAIEDSVSKADHEHQLAVEKYRNDKRLTWRKWKMKSSYSCDVCNTKHSNDSVFLEKITSKYWYYKTKSPGETTWSPVIHRTQAPKHNLNNSMFFEAFGDSLKAITAKKNELPTLTIDALQKKNELHLNEAFRESMPWGFVYNWGWDVRNDVVIFEVTFLNASKASIKTIDFHTVVTDDDKKVLAKCLFSADVTVPPGEYGNWRWETSPYKVDDSASNMSFSKIEIMYTDGTKKTLSGNELKVFRKS